MMKLLIQYSPSMAEVETQFKEYAYSVSHDLSASVRAMVEFSKMLVNEHSASLNEEGKEYLSIVIENGEKMQAMMEGLLVYSRLNTIPVTFSNVSITTIINNCLNNMKDEIVKTRAMIELGQLPTIWVDVDKITQLFSILLNNAIKYQAVGNRPHIKISAEQEEYGWKFSVTDNGIGIHQRYYEKIFKLFQRLHTDAEYSGVGIGLTLAQKIAQLHNGEIAIISDEGIGSSFVFTLKQQSF